MSLKKTAEQQRTEADVLCHVCRSRSWSAITINPVGTDIKRCLGCFDLYRQRKEADAAQNL